MPKQVQVTMQVQTHSRPDNLKKWLQDLVNTKGDKIIINKVEEIDGSEFRTITDSKKSK